MLAYQFPERDGSGDVIYLVAHGNGNATAYWTNLYIAARWLERNAAADGNSLTTVGYLRGEWQGEMFDGGGQRKEVIRKINDLASVGRIKHVRDFQVGDLQRLVSAAVEEVLAYGFPQAHSNEWEFPFTYTKPIVILDDWTIAPVSDFADEMKCPDNAWLFNGGDLLHILRIFSLLDANANLNFQLGTYLGKGMCQIFGEGCEFWLVAFYDDFIDHFMSQFPGRG